MSTTAVSQSGSAVPARSRLSLFWRVLTYLLLFILVNLIANLARVGTDALGFPHLASRLAFTIVDIAGVLFLTYVFRRSVDRKSWSGIGLSPLRGHLPQLAIGLVVGILIAAIVFGFEYATQWIRLAGYANGTASVVLLIDSLLLATAFGVCEEVCMRGYLFQNLAEARPVWQATLITGIIFGIFHLLSVGLGVRGLTFFVFAMLLNLFLVLTRLTTGSLWMAIGIHTAFDWAAINLGLGTVVLADQQLLQVERIVSAPAEDLLAACAVLLVICVLMVRQRNRPVHWNAPLSSDAQSAEFPA